MGGTVEFMNRLTRGTNGCGQLLLNDTYFSDICFSVVKTAQDYLSDLVYYCRTLNTIHKVFTIYVQNFDEIVSGRVSSFYKE